MEKASHFGYFYIMKKQLYIETTIWNHLVHSDRPDWHDSAKKFIASVKEGYYDAYISNVVIDEIMETKERDIRDKLMKSVKEVKPTFLEFTDEAKELTKKYMEAEFINSQSKRVYNDSSHVAVATVSGISHIVSYNFKHLVKDRRIDGFNGVNISNGYDHLIDITTPEKFIVSPEDKEL
jgi:predicted nucleic acid-binding protein